MIRIFGDVHAKYRHFRTKVESTPRSYYIIQAGDFGFWPRLIEEDAMGESNITYHRPVYVIDGNHEDFNHIPLDSDEIVEMYPNLFYVPRGTIMEMDGRTILFLGGGESPDKNWRVHGVSWFPEETIRAKDIMKIDMNKKIDMMITHVPPFSVVHHIFGGDSPADWNYSSKMVESVWEAVGKPPLYCGHLHMNRKVGNVTILNELNYIDV